MIVEILEQAKKSLIIQKEQRIASSKSVVEQKIIAPHTAEVDTALQEAIKKLASNRDTSIANATAQYEAETKKLVEVANKNKEDFANTAYASEVAKISIAYDNAVANIEKQIAEVKE